MKKETKANDFVDKPKYIGGATAWKKLLKENLTYPKKALEKKIEGVVNLSYEVNGNGKVLRPKVSKGLGYGCDEEAIRLVKMMKYTKANNRKLKIISHHKIAIHFKLPKPKPKPKPRAKRKVVKVLKQKTISYSLKPAEKNPKPVKKSYTYTIKF